MKKATFLLCILAGLAACRTSTPYNRSDDKQSYEQFMGSHVFAACENSSKPYATYSMAKLNKRPSDNDPRYKVTFVNGPCQGRTVWTPYVITKTEPVGAEPLPTGTLLLRNYHNPTAPYDREHTGRWHIGVVMSNDRLNKNIIDLGFPRDANDFNPAREGVYLHNVRYITAPAVKDIRTFLH